MKNVFVLLLFLSICSCNQSSNPKTKSDSALGEKLGWKIYDQPLFNLQYPSTWDLDTSGRNGTSFYIYSPEESVSNNFNENINLNIENLKNPNVSLDDYAENGKRLAQKNIPNFNLEFGAKLGNAPNEFYRMISTGYLRGYHMKFEQCFRIMDGKAYVLTLTTLETSFENYKNVGEKIMNSFRLKKINNIQTI